MPTDYRVHGAAKTTLAAKAQELLARTLRERSGLMVADVQINNSRWRDVYFVVAPL